MVIKLSRSFLKYVSVGVGALVAEYSSFILLYYVFHWQVLVANSISFCLGLGTSFTLNRIWTFKHPMYSKRATHQFAYYTTLALINLLFTNTVVAFFKHEKLHPLYGKALATAIIAIWNYLLFKQVIFSHKKIVTPPISLKDTDHSQTS